MKAAVRKERKMKKKAAAANSPSEHLAKAKEAQMKMAKLQQENKACSKPGKKSATQKQKCKDMQKKMATLNRKKHAAQMAGQKSAQKALPAFMKAKKATCGDGRLMLDVDHPNDYFEECDDGNKKKGDGCYKCKIEKGWSCIGGCKIQKSTCDKCGNGKLFGTEECDDGNNNKGDGCSPTCKIEKGFTCALENPHLGFKDLKLKNGPPPPPPKKKKSKKSVCSPTTAVQEEIQKLTQLAKSCRERGKLFLATEEAAADDNGCVSPPALQVPMEESHRQGTVTTSSPLSGKNTRIVSRVSIHTTCPIKFNDDAAYAVCYKNSIEVCTSTAKSKRICKVNVWFKCAEVCVATRHCEGENGKLLGRLVKRHHGDYLTPQKRACCFASCVTPPGWSHYSGVISPEQWCLSLAQEL